MKLTILVPASFVMGAVACSLQLPEDAPGHSTPGGGTDDAGATGTPPGTMPDGSGMPGVDASGTAPGDGGGRPAADGGSVPAGLGWHTLAQTKIRPHCPPNEDELKGSNGCKAVVEAWSGGIADTTRNQLVIWGGGHNDWYGNEVYVLDVGKQTMDRITDPSPVSNVSSCPLAYTDGKPSSRHTYGGLAYAANIDTMFAFGGSRANCGGLANDLWLLNLDNLGWTQKFETTPALTGPGAIADFDPVSGNVFLQIDRSVHRYDPMTGVWKEFETPTAVDYHLNGAIDPAGRKFYLFGNGKAYSIDIASGAPNAIDEIGAAGCDFKSADSPGVAYDSKQQVIVGWSGGGMVYTFHPSTGSCTSQSFPDGPGAQQPAGTFGRFRYFPMLNVFALVNDIDQDAFILRLTP